MSLVFLLTAAFLKWDSLGCSLHQPVTLIYNPPPSLADHLIYLCTVQSPVYQAHCIIRSLYMHIEQVKSTLFEIGCLLVSSSC